jgi:hypothetical protein
VFDEPDRMLAFVIRKPQAAATGINQFAGMLIWQWQALE